MALKGLRLLSTSGIQNLASAKAAGYEFGLVRANTGGKDDQEVTRNRNAVIGAGMLLGLYAEYNYDEAHGAKSGWAQAQDYKTILHADWQIPPTIALLPIKGVALPAPDKYVHEVEGYITEIRNAYGRPPILALSKSIYNHIAGQNLAVVMSCPAWVWQWGTNAPGSDPWGNWAFWEQSDAVETVSGATGVGLEVWPGSLDQLKAWVKSVNTPIPAYDGAPAPQPQPNPDPQPQPQPQPGPEPTDKEKLDRLWAWAQKVNEYLAPPEL